MQDYKPNSHMYKEEQKTVPAEKKVKKVVKGKVKVKKKNEISKLADTFISEDASNVKSYVLMDIMIPALKKLVSDIVTDGVDMILYGETGRTKKRSGSSNYVSYRSYSDRDRRDERDSRSSRTRFDYDCISFETKGEAEAVLEQMIDIIDDYGAVSVADLYDMVDLPQPYTGNKYGWTNLRNADTIRDRDGYKLKLPKATVI